MRLPVTIRHRTNKAKIYAPAGKFAYHRVAFATAGKRRMQTFANYSDAKADAERIVRELANGSQAAALNASQSRDALAALERLDGHFKSKGKRVSLNKVEGVLRVELRLAGEQLRRRINADAPLILPSFTKCSGQTF